MQQSRPAPRGRAEQREPEPDRGTHGQEHRPAGDRRRSARAGRQGRPRRPRRPCPTQATGRRLVAAGDAEQHRHERTPSAAIGATTPIVPVPARRRSRPARPTPDSPAPTAHGSQPCEAVPAAGAATTTRERHQGARLRASRPPPTAARRRRAQPGEEVRGAPQRARREREQGEHRAHAIGARDHGAAAPPATATPRPTLRWWRSERSLATTPPSSRRRSSDLRAARLRPEIRLTEVPAPQRIAPYAVALTAEVVGAGDDEDELASGRFVLLHDPAGPEPWDGALRAVTFARAELEPELATDPMLGAVGWSWLTDALDGARRRATPPRPAPSPGWSPRASPGWPTAAPASRWRSAPRGRRVAGDDRRPPRGLGRPALHDRGPAAAARGRHRPARDRGADRATRPSPRLDR